MPTMRRGDLEGGGAGLCRKVDLLAKGRQTGRINAPTSCDCTKRIDSAIELMATIMAGDLRGRAGSSINRGCSGTPVHTSPEVWSSRSAAGSG
jgi:hypothetical protein